MKLYMKVKFNRPVNKENETVSFGSFTVMVRGIPLRFDFMDTEITVSRTDPSIVEYKGWNSDTESFPEAALLEDYIGDITALEECLADFEIMPGSKPLSVIRVLDFVLEVDKSENNLSEESTDYLNIHTDASITRYNLKQEVLDVYNKRLKESWMEEEAEWLYQNTPDGNGIIDADTILKDQIDSLEDSDYTGIFSEILEIRRKAETPHERELLQDLFECFTGLKFVDYLKKCVEDTTK